MPLPVVAWLANVVFVVIPVMFSFMTLTWMIDPPHSFGEGLFEAHKVILVAGVTLAGVAIVEAIVLAAKLAKDDLVAVLAGGLILFIDAFFGVGLFSAALLYGVREKTYDINGPLLWQIIMGLIVITVAIYIAIWYKYIDCRISELEAKRLDEGTP